MGGGDLYISHKVNGGNWTPVKHLPSPINSVSLDYCPFVIWDKKYLMFTSNRLNSSFKDGASMNYRQLKEMLTNPGNSWDDIYRIKFDANGLK